MNTPRLLTPARLLALSLGAALLLGACTPRPKMTTQAVKSVVGLSMADVDAKLGRATSITNAGDSIWWEYDGLTTPAGNTDGSCHIVFRNSVAVEVRC